MYKQYYNQGLQAPLYFWRDKNGELEVDCLIERDTGLIPVKIKSTETFQPSLKRGASFKSLQKWNMISGVPETQDYLIYGDTQSFSGPGGTLVPWNEAGQLIKLSKAERFICAPSLF